MFIFFCEECKEFEVFKSKDGSFTCPKCGKKYLPLGTTVDEWNSYSNDQMLDAIETAKENAKEVARKQIKIKVPTFEEPEPEDNDIEYFDEEYEPERKSKSKLIAILAIIFGVLIIATVVIICVFVTKPLRNIKKNTNMYIEKMDEIDAGIGKTEKTPLGGSQLIVGGTDLFLAHAEIGLLKDEYEALSETDKEKYNNWLSENYQTTYDTLLKRAEEYKLYPGEELKDDAYYNEIVQNRAFAQHIVDELKKSMELEIVDKEFVGDGDYIEFNGTIQNNTDYTVTYLEYNISISDKNHDSINSEWSNWSGTLKPGAQIRVSTRFKKYDDYEYYNAEVTDYSTN